MPDSRLRRISEPGVRAVVMDSVLKCPNCGFARQESMPVDACLYFYECTACKVLLRPHAGHCCVFCSYGSVACPPVQQQLGCCRQ